MSVSCEGTCGPENQFTLGQRWLVLLQAFLLLLTLANLSATPAMAEELANANPEGIAIFQKEVRVVLAHHCVACHGGDSTESQFDLTTREGLLKGGERGLAITPGKADTSKLVKLIRHELDPKMPEEADKLSDAQIASIERWIELGAPYDKPLLDKAAEASDWTNKKLPDSARDYWAFQPLRQSAPPAVKNEAWVRTPIDRYILAKLEAKDLAPAQLADKRTLLRRAYFDLIGMPPTPAEAAEFLNDQSPEAYDKLIDRLLADSRYGERWGRHWLDVARFAESHGFEQDYDRPFAFYYRDFVIKALNQDMPYDQFVRWQLAGDELAPQDPLAMMATGFLGAGVFPTQITANEVERSRYDALDDMAATTGSAFLGMTVGCARCHDHKFDPIPQADYYRMISIFSTTVRSNIDLDLDPDKYRVAKAAFDQEHAPLAAELAKFEQEQLPARLEAWEAKRTPTDLPKWLVMDVAEAKSQGGAIFQKQADGSLLATGENVANDVYTFTVKTSLQGITAMRLEALADPSLKVSGPGRAANGNFCLTDLELAAAPADGSAQAVPVKLKFAASTFDQPGLAAATAVDDSRTSGWAVDPQFGKDHAAAFELEGVTGYPAGTLFTITLRFNNNTQHSIGRPRLSFTTAAKPVGLDGLGTSQIIAEVLSKPKAERTAEQSQQLLAWYKTTDPAWQEINARVQTSLAKMPQPATTKVMVCSEGVTPIRHHTQGADFFPESYYLVRGNCDNKLQIAEPGYLQVLSRSPEGAAHWKATPPAGATTSYRRTSLANWITDVNYGPGQQLARVMANRLWQHHLGQGIVATPNDFGVQGPAPTHPELLDYLAEQLIAGQWKLKTLHKQIMISATYMQASTFDDKNFAADPHNELLWRFTPRRLEGEAIRDSMLAVSGTLDRTMYGQGTLDEGHNRRSIYFMIKRSALIPTMQLFDAPEPLSSVGNRPSTTVAPQALLFMNNVHVRRWVTNFAGSLLPEADKSLAGAIKQGYQQALSRDPSEAELADAVAFLEAQQADYQQAGKPDPKRLALIDFCQVLLSMNEFLYIE